MRFIVKLIELAGFDLYFSNICGAQFEFEAARTGSVIGEVEENSGGTPCPTAVESGSTVTTATESRLQHISCILIIVGGLQLNQK